MEDTPKGISGELKTVPLIAHEVIIAKHKRREAILAVAFVISVVIGVASHLI